MSKVTLIRFSAVIVQREIGWTVECSQCKIREVRTKNDNLYLKKFPNGKNYVTQLKHLVLMHTFEEIFH